MDHRKISFTYDGHGVDTLKERMNEPRKQAVKLGYYGRKVMLYLDGQYVDTFKNVGECSNWLKEKEYSGSKSSIYYHLRNNSQTKQGLSFAKGSKCLKNQI